MAQSIRMPGARLKNKKHTPSRIKTINQFHKTWVMWCRLNNYVNRTDLCNIVPTNMNERKKEFLSPTL